jgi:hypothetical protein
MYDSYCFFTTEILAFFAYKYSAELRITFYAFTTVWPQSRESGIPNLSDRKKGLVQGYGCA